MNTQRNIFLLKVVRVGHPLGSLVTVAASCHYSSQEVMWLVFYFRRPSSLVFALLCRMWNLGSYSIAFPPHDFSKELSTQTPHIHTHRNGVRVCRWWRNCFLAAGADGIYDSIGWNMCAPNWRLPHFLINYTELDDIWIRKCIQLVGFKFKAVLHEKHGKWVVFALGHYSAFLVV